MVTSVPFLLAKVADDNDFLRLKDMANIHDDWSLDYDKNSIKIWSKTVPDATIKMVKVWAIFSAVSSNDLFNTLMDPTYRKEWDPHMIVGCDIGHLNPNNGVSYYAVSCPPPLRSRDFVLQTSWLDRGTEHFILNHSVCHKDYPPKKGYIRAISYFTGYFIKCISFNGCEMYFVSQTDPQGIIPAWIVNKCTQIFAPRFVKQLEKAAFGYSGWKSQNNPDFLPWIHPEQMVTPKITLEDCMPCEEEQQSPFFKYLAEKIARQQHQHQLQLQKSQPKIQPQESQQQFQEPQQSQEEQQQPAVNTENVAVSSTVSSTVVPGSSQMSTPVLNSSSSKGATISNGNTTESEKEEKRKKSKKSSWLNFTKMCFGKEVDS